MAKLNFQESGEGGRPFSESLNRETLISNDPGIIPLVGDYVCFDNEGEEETPYLVKKRLYEYKYSDKDQTWSTYINIVVERQNENLYNILKKM